MDQLTGATPRVLLAVGAILVYSQRVYLLLFLACVYGYCTSQHLIGKFLSLLMTNVVFHGHPMVFGPTFLRVWLDNGEVRVSVETEKVVLGNPPGFVHREFVSTRHLKLGLSMALGSIKTICAVCWKGRAKTAPLGLQEGNKAPYYGVVNINCIEFENVHIRFEYCKQRLNSIHFGRTLAEKELSALHGIDPGRLPNCLRVKVIGAKGISEDHSYCVVKCRQQREKSGVGRGSDPAWGEEHEFFCDDPNTLLNVEIESEGMFMDSFLGHYFCTVKYLVTNKPVCGWVQLLDEDYLPVEGAMLNLEAEWVYRAHPWGEQYKPEKMSALEQMDLLGEEDEKKTASWRLWRHRPILFKVGRITLRDVHVHIRDLFVGYTGSEESQFKEDWGGEDRRVLWRDQYGQKKRGSSTATCEDNRPHRMNKVEIEPMIKDPGCNAKELLDTVAGGLVYRLLQSNSLLGHALGDIIHGVDQKFLHWVEAVVHGETHLIRNVLRKVRRAAETTNTVAHTIGTHVEDAFAIITHAGEDVAMSDPDLSLSPKISGLLEKRQEHGIIHSWHVRHFTLKGSSVFYKSSWKKLRKFSLRHITHIKVVDSSTRKYQVLELTMANQHSVLLRRLHEKQSRRRSTLYSLEVLGGVDNLKGEPSLREWAEALQHARAELHSRQLRNVVFGAGQFSRPNNGTEGESPRAASKKAEGQSSSWSPFKARKRLKKSEGVRSNLKKLMQQGGDQQKENVSCP